MSDETTNPGGNGAAGGNGAVAGTGEAPNVRLVSHFIRDLSFENVAAQENVQAGGQPEISVQVNLDAGALSDTRMQVAMKIEADAKVDDKPRFLVELDYVGIFDLVNIPREHVHPALFIECPRLLLPYARRVVSDITRDGGFPPLMLDNVDFGRLYQARMAELAAEQAAKQGAGGGETQDA